MHLPEHLKHKPVIVIEDYNKIDGQYKNHTDAKGLSLGFAQWDNDELSAKVWRKPGNRWSRQAEELPLHRVLDVAILLCEACIAVDQTYSTDKPLDEYTLQFCLSADKEYTPYAKGYGDPDMQKKFVKLLKEQKSTYLRERFKKLGEVLGKALGNI